MLPAENTELSFGLMSCTDGICLSTLNSSVALEALLPASSKHSALQLCCPIAIPETKAVVIALLFEAIFDSLRAPSTNTLQLKIVSTLSIGRYLSCTGSLLTKLFETGLAKVTLYGAVWSIPNCDDAASVVVNPSDTSIIISYLPSAVKEVSKNMP